MAPHWQCGGQGFESPRLHNLMHWANTGVGRWFGWPCVMSGGDLEDRDEAVAVDLDFGYVCFDDCFALARCAGGQDVGEVVAELLDRLWAGWGWWVAGELVEFVAAGAELVELDRQVADAVAAGAFVVGAVFERGEVPVVCLFGIGGF